MAVNIAYYISSHGLGHLIRSLALVRFLMSRRITDFPDDQVDYSCFRKHNAREFNITVILNNPEHKSIIGQDPLLSGIRVEYREFDLDIETGPAFFIDIEATVNNFRDFIHKADNMIDSEKKYIRDNRYDLVITDIGFIPCAASQLAGIPSYILGNFTWEEVFYDYFQKGHNVYKSDIIYLLDCYNMADIYFQLPLALKNRLNARLKPVGFITRRALDMGRKIKKSLPGGPDTLWVFDSVDLQGLFGIKLDKCLMEDNIRFIVWDRFKKRQEGENTMYISESDFAFEEAVAGCDIVFGKPGYNLLSQCIIFNKKALLADRLDFVETETIISESKRYINTGIIEKPSPEYFLSGDFSRDLKSLALQKKGVRLKPPLFGELDVYSVLCMEFE